MRKYKMNRRNERIGAIQRMSLCAVAALTIGGVVHGDGFAIADDSDTRFDRAPVAPIDNRHDAGVTQTLSITATVQLPDGTPVDGAVVVTSVGGQGTSGPDGVAHLPIELDPTLETANVTAVAAIDGVNYVGTVPLELDRHLDKRTRFDVGELVLRSDGECEPEWIPEFAAWSGIVYGEVWAITVFDDGLGGGPALYVGGAFTSVGGVCDTYRIAKWDGMAWRSLGSGVEGLVDEMKVFDDGSGSGPALFVAGNFTVAGDVEVNHLAKWDGTTWSALGSGTNARVLALAVFDDGSGSGPALYAGGAFTTAGAINASHIAKWDGASWAAVGSGVNDWVVALTVFDDGSGNGPALYAGGTLTTAGEVDANYIAKWNGAVWSALGSGMNNDVRALTVFDDGLGSGPALYAGGAFTEAGSVSGTSHIARWDGTEWSALGSGMSSIVLSLKVFDDGTASGGPALYAGGFFSTAGEKTVNRIARWDGTEWSALGSGMGGAPFPAVRALAAFDDGMGGGPALFVGGSFGSAGGLGAKNIAKWGCRANVCEPEGWMPTFGDGNGMSDGVRALTVFDDGSGTGPALYAGGYFSTAGGVTVNGIAKWDGSVWSALGSGMGDLGKVYALTVFDDGMGGGPALYAGGNFTIAGGVEVNHIAKWDGTAWSALGSGIESTGTIPIYAFAVFDDGMGGGPALYAGGWFTAAGGVTANAIAKWDGKAWSAVGNGMNNSVNDLTVFDDGSGDGPALYAGGNFSIAGDVTAWRIAKWDGTTWSPLGSGATGGQVRALEVFDDNADDSPVLYVGGAFTAAGGKSANRIAKWNGTEWSALGNGINGTSVRAMALFDDGTGSGTALYIGGQFGNSVGCVQASNVVKWDGNAWSPLGNGIDGGAVFALTAFENAPLDGPALYAGGGFSTAGEFDSNFIAAYRGCPSASDCDFADINCDGVVDGLDLLILLSAWGQCADPDDCPADLNDDGSVDGLDLLILLANWG